VDWVVALPAGLTPRQAMTFGTAGFTAAQAVMALERVGVTPVKGEVLVTGATGGVGVFAVAILAKLGYQVVAMTGKPDRAAALRQLGAVRTVGRDLFAEAGDRPMLSEAWAGGVDTVGGDTLSALLRSTSHRGCVAACGLVGGHHLPITVYPFLLRGVTLAGIDSAKCPREPRLEVWRRLAGPWRVDLPEELVTEVTLDELPNRVDEMLAGRTFGRTLVKPTTTVAAPAAE
ncbi:MAG: zinc-binding dehydrogenase, partial [Planctomycetota bacterium]